MRHRYYLKQRHFAYACTKELDMEKPRSKIDRMEKRNVKTEKKTAKSRLAWMIRTPNDPAQAR